MREPIECCGKVRDERFCPSCGSDLTSQKRIRLFGCVTPILMWHDEEMAAIECPLGSDGSVPNRLCVSMHFDQDRNWCIECYLYHDDDDEMTQQKTLWKHKMPIAFVEKAPSTPDPLSTDSSPVPAMAN